MRRYRPPETGTLIMAAYLLLALVFAGYWITSYANEGSHPWGLFSWFGAAAVAIAVVGFLAYARRSPGGRS